MSDDVLRVEAGSLYPALHRTTEAGLLKSEWRKSDIPPSSLLRAHCKRPQEARADEKKWHTIASAVAKVFAADLSGQ